MMGIRRYGECGTCLFVWFYGAANCTQQKENEKATTTLTLISCNRKCMNRKRRLKNKLVVHHWLPLTWSGFGSDGVVCFSLFCPTSLSSFVHSDLFFYRFFCDACVLSPHITTNDHGIQTRKTATSDTIRRMMKRLWKERRDRKKKQHHLKVSCYLVDWQDHCVKLASDTLCLYSSIA